MSLVLEESQGEESWFTDKVCQCGRYKYPSANKEWHDAPPFTVIPLCGGCGLWADRVMTCARCRQKFYNYFRHKRMGYHPGRPQELCLYRGWMCWNCLEEYKPPVVEKYNATLPQCPPIPEILPPGYVLLGV